MQTSVTQETGSTAIGQRGDLDQHSWRHWFLLSGIALTTTIGLVITVPAALGDRGSSLWPWARTPIVLVIGLCLLVAFFVVYLTLQQRQVVDVRSKMGRLEDETADRAQRNYSRLLALLNVSRIMGTQTDIQSVFDGITSTCLKVFSCDKASLMLLDSDTQELNVRSATGHANTVAVLQSRQKIGQGIAGWVAEHREPVVLKSSTDIAQYPGLDNTAGLTHACMVVPIILRDELVGVLNVSSLTEGFEFSDEDRQALQVFAENAGMFIRHSEQAEWMRQTIQKLQASVKERSDQESGAEVTESS